MAGIIGAFIGTASKRKDSPFSMFVSLVAGISSAIIFTPLLAEKFGMFGKIEYGIAFLLGILGMSIISIILAVMETLKNNPKEIISFVKDIFFKDKTTVINNYTSENDKK